MSARHDAMAGVATDIGMRAVFAIKATDDSMTATEAAKLLVVAGLSILKVLEDGEAAAAFAYSLADGHATGRFE